MSHSDEDDGGIGLGGEVGVGSSGVASERSEREVRPFPGRAAGLGTLGGQLGRETIGSAAVRVRAGGCFELPAEEEDLPPGFAIALVFLGPPLGGNSQVSMTRFRRNVKEYILRHVETGGFCAPITV